MTPAGIEYSGEMDKLSILLKSRPVIAVKKSLVGFVLPIQAQDLVPRSFGYCPNQAEDTHIHGNDRRHQIVMHDCVYLQYDISKVRQLLSVVRPR